MINTPIISTSNLLIINKREVIESSRWLFVVVWGASVVDIFDKLQSVRVPVDQCQWVLLRIHSQKLRIQNTQWHTNITWKTVPKVSFKRWDISYIVTLIHAEFFLCFASLASKQAVSASQQIANLAKNSRGHIRYISLCPRTAKGTLDTLVCVRISAQIIDTTAKVALKTTISRNTHVSDKLNMFYRETWGVNLPEFSWTNKSIQQGCLDKLYTENLANTSASFCQRKYWNL